MTTEQLAIELHKDYRAASKFLRVDGLHDHGWAHCTCKRYFRQRAARKLPSACPAPVKPTLLAAAGPGPYTCKDCGQQYDFYHPPC